jgi:methyl-accepting chemotaxis protein
MKPSWTFGQKVGAGFAAITILTVLIGVIAVHSLRAVVKGKDGIIHVNVENCLDAERLNAAVETKSAAARGYVLTHDAQRLARIRKARADFEAALKRLGSRPASPEAAELLQRIERAEAYHEEELQRLLAQSQAITAADRIGRYDDAEISARREALLALIDSYLTVEQRSLEEARQAASDTATSAIRLVAVLAVLAALLALVASVVLVRGLTRQIGSAVQHVQSSSSELQTAANQQVAGAREQSAAMNEITRTINALLATSRQIAESAQRVVNIAEDTASTARAGEQTVGKTGDSIALIKRQVDLIVTHMLDLGKKSQQIGGILELINELAEQTNILAINATIEAAGAGEAGRRFAVVAEEIRKLADRVAGSTKEIRGLIDEIRGAVNTTVMTTEGGSKAVDSGTRQFADLAEALQQIVGSVATTTAAAREIELSTRQQASAVEQVIAAISNVAQATRETEASASQTLQTASELSGLSTELIRLVRRQASA